jgi:hypothetical protein
VVVCARCSRRRAGSSKNITIRGLLAHARNAPRLNNGSTRRPEWPAAPRARWDQTVAGYSRIPNGGVPRPTIIESRRMHACMHARPLFLTASITRALIGPYPIVAPHALHLTSGSDSGRCRRDALSVSPRQGTAARRHRGMWIFDAAHTIRRSIPAIRFRCYLA